MGKRRFIKNCNELGSFIKSQDMFGADVQFNIGGQSKLTSIPGVVLTFIITCVIIAFTIFRFQVMVYQENPNVT
jgi:hypothetical protein